LDDEEIAAGASTEARIDVSYFFGGPVADAEVEWVVLAEPYRFSAPGVERYSFDDPEDPWICYGCWWWDGRGSSEVVASGRDRTDDTGTLAVALSEELTDAVVAGQEEGRAAGSRRLTIEATAYGRDGQVLSGRAGLIVHRGAFYIGLAPEASVGRAGEPMTVETVVVDWQGVRRAEQRVRYAVIRREWVNRYVEEGDGGRWEWTTEDTEVATGEVTTDALGLAAVSFTPPDGGLYRVSVSGRDARERVIRSSVFVWASGPGTVSWRRENHDRLTLIADKTTYRVGDTARILIPSPYEGEHWAWVSVERGTLLSHEVVRLTSTSTVYELAIEEDHIPNVYVSVVLIQGRDAAERQGGPALASHKVGYAALAVDRAPRRLELRLSPSVDDPRPGDELTYELEALDANGDPVRGALAVDVVDKAVLTLAPREPDAILDAFYGARALEVRTASGLTVSVERLLDEQLEDLGMIVADDRTVFAAPPAAMAAETAGAEERAAANVPEERSVRQTFEDTAYWNGRVVTDASGRATFTVSLPDNVTTWVVRAVGITSETLVGEATQELLVTKPLLVRPVTPRFLVVDDRVLLAALVNNNTDAPIDAQVAIEAEGLTLEDDAVARVTIPAHGESRVTWWARVQDVAAVDVIVRAMGNGHEDAAKPRLTTGPDGTLLVHRYLAPEIVGTAGSLAEEGVRTESIALPPFADPEKGSLTVRLDPSLAAATREGLTYLQHFEYECTEQLVSRFLPNILNYRALVLLGVDRPDLRERLEALVDEALTKLYPRQRGDGGWGWWSGGHSNPVLTAYVAWAMSVAEENGFTVDAAALDAAVAYLETQLFGADELDLPYAANTQAWLLYVLAESGHDATASESVPSLYGSRDHLAHYARALLMLVMHRIDEGDPRIATLRSEISSAAIVSATGTHWEEEGYGGWLMNTDTRSTAIILDALVKTSPESGTLPNVVRWLMVARRDGIWETTQETAWALIALTDWMVATGELESAYDFAVDVDGTELLSGRTSAENVEDTAIAQLPVGAWENPSAATLSVSRGAGPGRLYYTAHVESHLPVEQVQALDRGIVVQRQYVSATCGAGEACEPLSTATVGQIIGVRLTIIAPHDLYYVVLEDPLPAGGEAIDPQLATTSLLDPRPVLTRDDTGWGRFLWSWWWRWYSHSEFRDDKVVLFADSLPAGTYTYSYSFRATQAGSYHVMPTTAREFYFPEVFGRGEGMLFEIVEP
jgi:hypothetical protein